MANSRVTKGEKCSRCGVYLSVNKSRCVSCGHWNNARTTATNANGTPDGTELLSDVRTESIQRIVTNGPWDKCFGADGISTTSVNLIGGEPGAGKSTLSLQLADAISFSTKREVMYIAAEESSAEIASRAKRLTLRSPHLVRLYPMGNEADLMTCFRTHKPSAVFLDSLPGFCASPDESVELSKALKPIAVELTAPFFIIDHVTKDSDFAGFMALQHAVDATFTLYRTEEGEQREMKTIKNRYGPANIEVLLLMTEFGLVADDTRSDE